MSLLAQNRAVYKSEADSLLTVRTVSILPVFDNMQGIYSRPVEAHLIDTLNKMHNWELLPANSAGAVLTPDELEESPDQLKNIAQNIQSDAFISTSVIKGPAGVSIKMSLFLRADQKLLAQEIITGSQRFDINAIKSQSVQMLNNLFKRIPYSGLVLSRQNTRVTVNLGKKDNIAPDQILSVIQIIKVNRHPKFNFIVSTEKEILGKIKILKVDDTLSFGRIITEKESEAIQINAKIDRMDSVVYANTNTLSDNNENEESLEGKPDGAMTYGKNPIAWLPQRQPTFGMVGARIGVGQFVQNVNQSTGTLDVTVPLYPTVSLDGEVWLTPAWSMHAKIKQGIITSKNPVSGGTPADLTHSLSAYEFLFGYNLRLSPAVNSAKIEGLFGFSTYRLFVDDSTPTGFTTKTYSGMKFGVAGSYPIAPDSPYSLGANLNFLFGADLSESPSVSGSSENSVNSFGAFVDKQISINLKIRYTLDFELYASDFSGTATQSSSQKHTSLSAGLYYLF